MAMQSLVTEVSGWESRPWLEHPESQRMVVPLVFSLVSVALLLSSGVLAVALRHEKHLQGGAEAAAVRLLLTFLVTRPHDSSY